MGLEAVCSVAYDGANYQTKVLLETEALIFRGELKRTFPFREMSGVAADGDTLSFTHSGVPVEVRVGPKAAAWADKILNPKSLLDKLGVKPGDTVALIGVSDSAFREQLLARTESVIEGSPDNSTHWVFFQVETNEALDRLVELRKSMTQSGAIWVLHPKGRQDIKDVHVIAAAKAAGLVDVKVVGFSLSHSALKLVIPREQRQ